MRNPAFLMFAIVVGCTGRDSAPALERGVAHARPRVEQQWTGPTRAEVAQVIRAAPVFHRREALDAFPVAPFRLSVGKDLQDHLVTEGWLEADGDLLRPTPKALACPAFIKMPRDGHYGLMIGDRELIAVTGIASTGYNLYTAEFTWHYIPTEPMRGLSGSPWDDTFSAIMRATAQLRSFDDGWRITELSPMKGYLSERVTATQ